MVHRQVEVAKIVFQRSIAAPVHPTAFKNRMIRSLTAR
jgi:hypothetical protein